MRQNDFTRKMCLINRAFARKKLSQTSQIAIELSSAFLKLFITFKCFKKKTYLFFNTLHTA